MTSKKRIADRINSSVPHNLKACPRHASCWRWNFLMIFILSVWMLRPTAGAAVLTGGEIGRKLIDRDEGRSRYSKSLLLTCEFKEKDGKRSCVAAKRKKIIESASIDLDAKGKHRKSISVIVEPRSELGVIFLQEDFASQAKDSQQWTYLPTLKKMKRIVSTESGGPKTGTLFESELAYEDIEKIHHGDYRYMLLTDEKFANRNAWVLEAVPAAHRIKKSSYSKAKLWVDKETYIPLKSEFFDREGRLVKSFFSGEIEKVNGIWLSNQLVIVNHKTKRMSMLQNTKVKVNVDVPLELLSERSVSDASFRALLFKKLSSTK